MRISGLLTLIAACGAFATARQTITELWPEVNIWLQPSAKVRLLLYTEEDTNRQLGASIYYSLAKRWTSAFGYSYHIARTGPDLNPEDRWYIEGSYRMPLGNSWTLADRNREEFRWFGETFQTRYRNRIRLERPTMIGGKRVVPYASAEFFYQSNVNAWTREEYHLGVQTPCSDTAMLDTYLTYQQNEHNRQANVWALGVVLNLLF